MKEYLISRGVKQKWLAEQLGLSRRFFNYVVHNKRALPPKYWTKVIVKTNGEVTIDDLLKHRERYDELYGKKTDAGSSGELSEVPGEE